MTRLLGIDVGLHRIGIAVADTDSGQVVPLGVVARSSAERDRAVLTQLLREQRIDEIVVGLPLSLDGGVGPQATATRDWAAGVLAEIGVPAVWRDERFTTERAITRVGGPARGSGGGPPSPLARRAYRRKLDREAAALILQAELDARAGIKAAG